MGERTCISHSCAWPAPAVNLDRLLCFRRVGSAGPDQRVVEGEAVAVRVRPWQ
jgi:hypothetical protein